MTTTTHPSQHDAEVEVDCYALPDHPDGDGTTITHRATTSMAGLSNVINDFHRKIGEAAIDGTSYDVSISLTPLRYRLTPMEIPGSLTRRWTA